MGGRSWRHRDLPFSLFGPCYLAITG